MFFPIRLAFLVLLAAAPRASAQTVIFSEGFENGLGPWTATGLWSILGATDPCGLPRSPFPGGTHAAYYGDTLLCTYDTPGVANAGELTLVTPIAIPASTPRAWLGFRQRLEREPFGICAPDYLDRTNVDVSIDGGATWITSNTNCDQEFTLAGDVWLPYQVDLTGYRGQSLLVRFSFQTVNASDNAHFGWMIDDVTVTAESGQRECQSLCPCNNQAWVFPFTSTTPFGCRNSFQGYGDLAGDGLTSLASDSLTLRARALPTNAAGILLEALSTGPNLVFGDGILCLAAPLRRVSAQTATNGVLSWPSAGAPGLSSALQASVPPAGLTVHYQVYYRDVASFCTPATFNTTNSYRVVWTL